MDVEKLRNTLFVSLIFHSGDKRFEEEYLNTYNETFKLSPIDSITEDSFQIYFYQPGV